MKNNGARSKKSVFSRHDDTTSEHIAVGGVDRRLLRGGFRHVRAKIAEDAFRHTRQKQVHQLYHV